MAYAAKIEENSRALKKCRDISAFNVGASRAYYCAFIKAKYYLESMGFDYRQFLVSIGLPNEKLYSHGTIKRAVISCMIKNGKTIKNIAQINVLDNLYNKRKIADYQDIEISLQQFEDSMREVEIVTSIIGV